MRARGYLALAVAIAFSTAACGDLRSEERRSELRAGFVEDEGGAADWLIDFGDVLLGSSGVEAVDIRNLGAIPLRLQSAPVAAPFFIEGLGDGIEIGPGGSTTLLFRFIPVEAGQEQIVLTIVSNEEGGGVERSLRLVGEGVVPALRCDLEVIDFGQVPRGVSRTLETACTNPLSVELELAGLQLRGHFAQSFRARKRGNSGLPIKIGPSKSIELEIDVLTDTLGANRAALVLHDGEGGALAELQLSAEVAVSALEIEPPGCLAFGYVTEGERRTEVLRLRSRGAAPMEVREFQFLGEGLGAFVVETALPLRVPAKDEPPAELHLGFEPLRAGQVVESLELLTHDEVLGSGSVSLCLSGFGGGPRLRCDEVAIDFGPVAMEEPGRRRLRCSNEGTAPEGVPVDPVFISEVATDHPSFSASLVGPDGSASTPPPGGFAAGESFEVEVVFSPAEEAIVSAELLLRTNAAPSGVYTVPLTGDGRRHLPCVLAIEPDELRFGTVDRGDETTRRVRIENLVHSSCQLESVQLMAGSDPSFFLESIEGQRLEGFGERWIDVHFSPTRYKERFAGAVEIRFVGSGTPTVVALSGRSAPPCLVVDPSPIELGSALPGCGAPPKTFSIRNICEEPVRLLELGIEGRDGNSVFQLVGGLSFPREIQANDALEGFLQFLPSSSGLKEGALYATVDAGVGDRNTYVFGLRGEGAEGFQTDAYTSLDRPKVDVLWVLDNTRSTTAWQGALAANLSTFLSVAERENVDFHLAMTTSGLTERGSCPGGARGGENGRLFPIDGSSPRILKANTPDLEANWITNLDVGSCNNWREYYEAAHRALSEPLVSSDKDPRYENDFLDGNAGFLRSEAALSIIFVAPGSDNSGTYGKTPADYLAFFQGVKGGDASRFRAHAITDRRSTDPESVGGGCFTAGFDPDRLMISVDGSGGAWVDICLPAWDTQRWTDGIQRLSEAVFADTRRFPLRGWPADQNADGVVDEADLLVEVDGAPMPSEDPVTGAPRWFFDPSTNEFRFERGFTPAPDQEIKATYRLACGGTP